MSQEPIAVGYLPLAQAKDKVGDPGKAQDEAVKAAQVTENLNAARQAAHSLLER